MVLTAPATPDTRGMINAATLSQMRPDAFLVNVARGELVVERDLVGALKNRGLAGAGLDVFQVEPLPADSELLELNVVLGSHNGSDTVRGLSGPHSAQLTSCWRNFPGHASGAVTR